jgi:acetylornithine/succinyldiaminopimelate/putrescine aminotransferase
VKLDEHGSTFGGGPLACAAALATLNLIVDKAMPAHANAMGAMLKEKLGKLPHVLEVRGMGLLLGLRLDKPAKDIHMEVFNRGVIVGTSADPNVLRVMPPMVVTPADIDHLVAVLADVLGINE